MSGYRVPNTCLSKFCNALTRDDIEKLKIDIVAAVGEFDNVFEPIDFLIVLNNRVDHNPYQFDSALQRVRPDLVEKARLIPWLSLQSSGDEEKNGDVLSMKSFVHFLNAKISPRVWKNFLNQNEIYITKLDLAEVAILCLNNKIIEKDLINLRNFFESLKKKDLLLKLEPYVKMFSKINEWEFGDYYFCETQKVIKLRDGKSIFFIILLNNIIHKYC